MNKIITLPSLVALLAEKAGITHAEAEQFINAFTTLTGDVLASAEQIKIKGIGTFHLSDIGSSPIVFMPDPDLAAKVNEPFSFFEAVELNDGVTEEMLAPADQPAAELPEPEPQSEPEPEYEPETEPEPAIEIPEQGPVPSPEIPEPEAEPDPQPEIEPEPQPQAEPEIPEQEAEPEADTPVHEEINNIPEETVNNVVDNEEVTAQEDDDNAPYNSFFPTYWVIWAAVIGILIGFAIGFFTHDPVMDAFFPIETEIISDEAEAEENTVAALDSIIEEPTTIPAQQADTVAETKPAPQPEVQSQAQPEPAAAETEVYDTITKSCFLTTLAYKHYGKKDYWVYIYMDNTDKIRNPDMVRPGTRVRIPPKSKYATAPTEEENLRAARNKAAEIYRKYK